MLDSVTTKTLEEIKILRQGGKILAEITRRLAKEAKPGVSTGELDFLAEKLIDEAGGKPSFKGFQTKGSPFFPTTLCTSINDEIVHAPALPSRILKDGDLLKIDIGMKWPVKKKFNFQFSIFNGLYTDMAITVGIGKVSKEAKKIMKVTKKALEIGIRQAKPQAKISDIGRAIQKYVESKGFNVVRDLTGHGVGYQVHEPPEVPNFWQEGMEDCLLKEGMVLCIEPMVNAGSCQIKFAPDCWTVLTSDCSLSAHFEHTIVITKKGAEIITL